MTTLGSRSSDFWGSEEPAFAEFVAAAALEVAVLVLAITTVAVSDDRMIEVENLDAVLKLTDVVVSAEAVAVTLAEVDSPWMEVSVAVSDVVAADDVSVFVFSPRRVEKVDRRVDSVVTADVVLAIDWVVVMD